MSYGLLPWAVMGAARRSSRAILPGRKGESNLNRVATRKKLIALTTLGMVNGVPVEAESVDRDGVRVQILLHVANGRVKELEFYKVDGSKVLQLPDADGITISP